LAKTAVSLLYNDIDFVLLGRDLSKEFVELIEQVTGTGRKAIHYSLKNGEFQQKLSEFVEKEEKRFGFLQARQAYLETLRDNSEALTHIIGFLESKGFQDCNMQVLNSQYLIQYMQRKFSGVNPDSEFEMKAIAEKNPLSFITLTSAHRSKGMEYERVYILAPEKFPSKNAKTQTELQQEKNMYYVALTRAKAELNICSPEPKESK
jgi:DNA helicase-2/ATP-dependent DNA helicase PcrA